MTDRFVSWTDAATVARLVAQASKPQQKQGSLGSFRRVSKPRAELGATAMASPTAAVDELRTPTPSGASTTRTTPEPPVPTAPEPVPQAPPIEHTSNHPADRLDTLLAWTMDHHKCDGAFVADDNGLTLAAHGISEAHVSSVGPLLSSMVSVRSIPGVDASAGALWLGSKMMSWVETRNSLGGFCLGTVGAEALTREELDRMQEALRTTFENI